MLMTTAGLVLGIHLATAHSSGGMQGFNPGLYLRQDSGLTVGAYRNSYGRASAYAGWTFETADKRFALTVGAVSGYPAAPLMPVVVPSVRFALGQASGEGAWAVRVSLLPKPPKEGSAAGVHLSIERGL